MSLPAIHDFDWDDLEEAGKIASMIVGEEEYDHIRSNGGSFRRDYRHLEAPELIELATEVVNGEYPEIDERFSYGGDNWSVKDFVDNALEAQSTPYSSSQKHSEMLGSTQLEEEEYELSDIAETHNNFISAHVEDSPPSALNYSEEEEKVWLEIFYTEGGETVKFADYVSLVDMEDLRNETDEADTREHVYWPQ